MDAQATSGSIGDAQWQKPQAWGHDAHWAQHSWQYANVYYDNSAWGWQSSQPSQGAAPAAAAGHGAIDTGCEPECANEEDRERARRTYAIQQAAIAQQSQQQGAGFASAQAAAAAAEVHNDRLAEIKREARANGIEFDEAELDAKSPHDMEQWAKQHLK